VINLGLEVFAREVEAVGIEVVHVDWRPPAPAPDVAAETDSPSKRPRRQRSRK